jgi:hypothetical protein
MAKLSHQPENNRAILAPVKGPLHDLTGKKPTPHTHREDEAPSKLSRALCLRHPPATAFRQPLSHKWFVLGHDFGRAEKPYNAGGLTHAGASVMRHASRRKQPIPSIGAHILRW